MKAKHSRWYLIAGVVIAVVVLAGCPQPTDSPQDTYTIRYDANGADSGSVPVDSGTYAPQDSPLVLGNTGGLTKAGYLFNGWNTAADGSGTQYSEGSFITFTGAETITLYAQWVELQQSAAPSFSPDAGEYASTQTVTISAAPGAVIYYTTNGDDPDTNATAYAGAFDVAATTTVKAIAVESGKPASIVAEVTYTILAAQSPPTFAPLASLTPFEISPQTITVTADPGATVYYTITYTPIGGSPVEGSEQTYTAGIEIGGQGEGTYLIVARAEKAGAADATAQASYIIDLPDAAQPTIGPPDRIRNSDTVVTIETATTGATIYYTTDAANDDVSTWAVWTPGSLTLTTEGDYTVKAVAGGDGFTQSSVVDASFTIDKTAPSFTGSYDGDPAPTITEIRGLGDIFEFDFSVADGPIAFVYVVAVSNGTTPPDAGQVVAFEDGDGTDADFGRRLPVRPLNPAETVDSSDGLSLTMGDYDWYFVAEDAAGNRSGVAHIDALYGYSLGGSGTYTVTPSEITAGQTHIYSFVANPANQSWVTYTSMTLDLTSLGGPSAEALSDGDGDGTWTGSYEATLDTAGTYYVGFTFSGTELYGHPLADLTAAAQSGFTPYVITVNEP